MFTHKSNSKKNLLFKDSSLIVFVVLIFFNLIAVPTALSQSSATTVILYQPDHIKQFTEGQVVKLRGQVIYHTSEGGTGVSNVYYKIINQDTGQVIHDGYTDSSGLFSYDWTSENSNDKRETNLKGIFPGSNYYGYAESNTLTLEIFAKHPLPKKDHNVSLYLDVTKGSRSDSIRVFPKYTDDFGNTLSSFTVNNSEEFIEIYIDNKQFPSIKPNQWSADITVGYGSHNTYAKSPALTITNIGERYLSATSAPQSISLQAPTVPPKSNPQSNPVQSPTVPPKSNTQNIPVPSSTTSSGTQDQSGFIALGIIAVIGIVSGVTIMKRKKLSTTQGGIDDTQVY